MEIQLNKLLLIVLFLIFTCKDDVQKKRIVSQTPNQQSIQSIDFFNKKYATDYTMIVDESTLADHPIQTFLDCKDSYFTIHYIPKNQELQNFWSQEYFQNRNIDNIDFEKESKEIETKIKNNINDYAIFCYYISPKYIIKSNNGCTIESAYLAENTLANIYYFNHQNKNWELLKQDKSTYLPRIIETKYFTSNFPTYFNQKEVAKILSNENNTENVSVITWNGKYAGTFLRLKDESADPRAWGKIMLEINDKNVTLNIDSYVEIVQKNLTVISESQNELQLKDKSSDKLLTITKKSNKILLKGNLMESIVGSNEEYEIEKIKK